MRVERREGGRKGGREGGKEGKTYRQALLRLLHKECVVGVAGGVGLRLEGRERDRNSRGRKQEGREGER